MATSAPWPAIRDVTELRGRYGDCVDRRRFLTVLSAGVAAALAGCADDEHRTSRGPGVARVSAPVDSPSPTTSSVPERPTFSPVPSPPPFNAASRQVFSQAPNKTRAIALTIDDGTSAETVAAYVELAARTGIHLTFSPNGVYSGGWSPHATVLRPLLEQGQVQIVNHTFHHLDLKKLSAGQIEAEIASNETWVNETFGTSSRPYLRPPYGFYDARVEQASANAGFNKVLMWNGTFGDSALLTPQILMQQAQRYLQPGTVMLGHANHPTVTHLYDQIIELIVSRDLTPVTLDEMFGSTRNRV
jgi:peptidoglycan/xylan/chitin deacetylase (PgdA/CDA1 family)